MKQKTLLKIGIFSGVFLLLVMSIVFQSTLSPELKINEVSFQNNNKQDWIEIYNPGLNTKNLKGMYLTDDKAEKTKFQIEDDVAIHSKGFLVIGGKNSDKNEVALKTDFGLKNGETLYLISTSGVEIVDSFPLLLEDEDSNNTVGRFPDGEDEIFTFSTSTKGEKNIKDTVFIPHPNPLPKGEGE
jgi:hypothetical protein